MSTALTPYQPREHVINRVRRIGSRAVEVWRNQGIDAPVDALRIINDDWCYIEIGAQRLHHTSIDTLIKPAILHTLEAAVGCPVRVLDKYRRFVLFNHSGSINRRSALPPAALPTCVDLDLSRRPPGEYMIGFGASAAGEVWCELSGLTHILVAGSSDSGKSAFLRSLVYQLAAQPLPVKLYLADLEGLTFSWAEHWQIVKAPVAQNVRSATQIGEVLMAEIERRATLYAATGRFPESLAEYHQAGGEPLAWIVAIFDEFTALLEAAGLHSYFTQNLIAQIAQRSRKFGVTLVLAGQDFKTDVLPSRIANQLKTRLQFRCANAHQSRVVLGAGGAEHLATPGRAIARLDGRLVELQSFWVSKACVLDTMPRPDESAPRLSPQEIAFFARVAQQGGAVRRSDIRAAFGIADHPARDLAHSWEHAGWITPPGAGNQRRLTEATMQIVESGTKGKG